LGLGFDFSRVEYDVVRDLISVDGVSPKGWRFYKFQVVDNTDDYVGMVAEFRDDDEFGIVWVETSQLRRAEAFDYVTEALQKLDSTG